MVEGEIAARFEDPTPHGEHEIQIEFVAQCGGSDPNATRRGCAATPNPTATMEVNLVAPRRVDPHGLVPFRWKKQMPMISGEYAMLDACRGKLADSSRQVVDDRTITCRAWNVNPLSPA